MHSLRKREGQGRGPVITSIATGLAGQNFMRIVSAFDHLVPKGQRIAVEICDAQEQKQSTEDIKKAQWPRRHSKESIGGMQACLRGWSRRFFGVIFARNGFVIPGSHRARL